MLGKNNRQMYQNLHVDQHQHWALRKLSLGLTSVLVSVSIYAGTNATKAEAASNPADSTTSETEITAGTASTSGSTAILKTSQGGSSTTSTANSPAASTANSSATVASNNSSATVTSQATSSANATSQNANSSTKQASSASQTSTTNLNVADLTSDQANATANLTTNLAVSSSANTPNVITPSYQDTTFTLPEKDNSNAEINITKPTDYPQVDWISNDYWIFEEVHEWTAVGYRHDYYVAVKADGSSTQTGTVYLFDSRSKQMTTVEKGQFVQLAGNDGDRFYNSGRTISFLNVNQTSCSYYKHYNVLYSLYNKYADNEQPWYNSVSEFIPILGPLVVHYQDQTTGQEIISSTEIAMMTGNSYDVTNPPKIDGYTYVGVKNNTTGHISNYNDATVGQQWDEHFGFSQLSKNSYDVYTTYTYEGKNTEGVGKFKLETYVDGLIYHTDEMDSMNPVRIMLPDGGYIDLANPSLQGENDVTFLYKKNPDDVETTTESKTVKRTIKYIDKTTGEAIPSNLAKPVEQDVTLTRTKS